jgi:glycosyltransferase involved in cell wall biosynthesis
MDDSELARPCGGDRTAPSPSVAPVAVVIPCHNYARYLSEALDSVLAQDLPPAEIVVVDDASTDDTHAVAARYAERGVRYLRVEHRDVHRTRRTGFRATTAPLLACLDADDRLGRNYLRAAIPHFAIPEIGIVTTDLHCFGETHERRAYPQVHPERQNWIHSAAVVRRAALELSGAFEGPSPAPSHADWFLWRAVQNYGFRAVNCEGVYHYRVHADSMLHQARHESYRTQAAVDLKRVTLVLPLSGRRAWWDRLRDWVESQTWPLERLEVMVTDTGPPDWSREIRSWLATLPAAATSYFRFPDTWGLADRPRAEDPQVQQAVALMVPRLYQFAFQRCGTEYLLTVEDDILPPLDALDRLFDAMAPDVAAVSGAYRGRFAFPFCFAPEKTAWGVGREPVDACGFGCLLLRRSAWQQSVLHCGGRTDWYDFNFGYRMRELGWRLIADWEVRCLHQNLA